jgi:hypothetical protein
VDFPIRVASVNPTRSIFLRSADLEIGDTAGWDTLRRYFQINAKPTNTPQLKHTYEKINLA